MSFLQLEEERAKKENVSPTKLPPVMETQEPADLEAQKSEQKSEQKVIYGQCSKVLNTSCLPKWS